jgi:hypothetical protein
MNGATALAGLRRDVDLTSTGADALAATPQGARTTSALGQLARAPS